MLYHQYLKKLKFCPFCKSSGRIFLEREHAYLTYAKSPYHPHHLLVTPKRHLVSFFSLRPEEKKDIDELIKVGAGLLKKLKYRNFTVLVREGDQINKSIRHLHYHLIPNDRIGDLDHQGQPRKILSDEEIVSLSAQIHSLLNPRKKAKIG